MGRYTAGGLSRDILAGAAAGVAAIWVADKLDKAIHKAGGAEAMGRTQAAQPGGMDPAHVLAKRAADAVGANLSDPRDNLAGHGIHYGIAAGLGAVYGLFRGLSPSVTAGRGALFGFTMFILQDKVGNAALGASGNPFNYPLRDHARGAAVYTLFGVLTDLGTRILAPWRNTVVIEQGPPISERLEHGRDYLLEQGREYAQQGIGYAGQLAEQAKSYLPDVDTTELSRRGWQYAGQAAEAVRSRLPDADDVADLARSGRKQAGRLVEEARSRLPDADDVADLARSGQKRAGRLLDDVRARLPDGDDVADLARSGRKQAARLAKEARSRLPDPDDVADLARSGRKRAGRLVDEARDRLPDADDVADLAKAGRREAGRMARDARSYVEDVPTSGFSRAMKRLFG